MKLREKGYTLVELLIAVTIMVVASGAAGAAIFQVIRNTERNNDHMAALLQVQNAGYWISRDARMAQSVTTDLSLPELLIVSWNEYDTSDQYQVTYNLEDMAEGGFKKLFRNQSVNDSANITSFVAQYIDSEPEKTSCNFTSGILSLTITATVGEGSLTQSETRIYEVVPRSY
ncbi:prepilin-type N-terminal cleavage/methylation domain-containing protein [Chloroflexota bacterium]